MNDDNNKILKFSQRWQNISDEKGSTQKFWLELMSEVLGIDKPWQYIEFEKRVELTHMSYIDAYIPLTRTIIEQKSRGVDLTKPAPQSDGSMLTPFEQAKRYRDWLPASQQGRYIIVSNFAEIHIHDMEQPKAPPKVILLQDIEREKHHLSFLITPDVTLTKEEELSIQAGKLAQKLYSALKKRYININDKNSRKSLNIFCVRIVFLLYAEDSGLFRKSQFHNYLKARISTARQSLIELFSVLNTKKNERDPYIDAELQAFPYVNGGLFEQKNIEIPQIDGEPLSIILHDMSEGFDWSEINPTIFGAIFESILSDRDKKTKFSSERKTGGMHYTTTTNIHKAIDKILFDELHIELATILNNHDTKQRTQQLEALRTKLTALKFFDPACGSGNFLTETYISLCEIESVIIRELHALPFLQVSISQFYGIEINDFAAAVARTALWIAEIQMFRKVNPDDKPDEKLLPLETSAHILEANALRTSWRDFLPDKENVYIIGNPPFIGYSGQNPAQKADMLHVYVDRDGKTFPTAGKIDYVSAWYYKACEYMTGTKNKAAFVSTNSICQGEQVAYVWEPLFEIFGMHIDFAHQAFLWESEAAEKAQVHIVIIGFSIYDDGRQREIINKFGVRPCANINAYLVPGPNIFVRSTTKSLTPGAPPMKGGNKPMDGGHLLLTPEQRSELLMKCPEAERWIKRYMMGDEFINGIERYCLWLVGAAPKDLASMPPVMERIKLCREDRLAGAKDRQKLANTAWLFRETNNPERYLAIPKTSSCTRSYIPMGFLDSSVIPGDGLRIIPDADLYTFGVLTSWPHMAWMRRVGGYLGTSYSYSAHVVYNPYPWPVVCGGHYERITETARGILAAREKYAGCTYAELYNDLIMPVELRAAHEANDRAVCEAYGFGSDMTEEDIAGALMDMYDEMRPAGKGKM